MNAVVLDTTPLGLLCHPHNPPSSVACWQWLIALEHAGRRIVLSEIADYEYRRECHRRGQTNSISQLTALAKRIEYLAISTPVMHRAAELWGQVRQLGRPTAADHALDGDVILAAQATSLGVPVIVATNNVAHISRFVAADRWENMRLLARRDRF